jgi:Brp/Blh family beta-carotene 15,15'-monooxygenase
MYPNFCTSNLPTSAFDKVHRNGGEMKENELRLFHWVRNFSTLAVLAAILLSLIFSNLLGSSSMGWQITVAVIALAIGIPHGALDHLVTLPRSKPATMVLFICIYVAIAAISVIAILRFNTAGFIVVVVMSATHFGIGDAAFLSEMDRRSVPGKKLPRFAYAVASGFIPVLIPLVNSASSDALKKVNPALVDWHGGFDGQLLIGAVAVGITSLFVLIIKGRKREATDIALLLTLSLVAPPLIAFAVYFGCWHAMRHTARLTLVLKSSQSSYQAGMLGKAFTSAVLPGVPALVGTFAIAGVLAAAGQEFNNDFFWMALVVVWALTVPHMMVTARLDRAALT